MLLEISTNDSQLDLKAFFFLIIAINNKKLFTFPINFFFLCLVVVDNALHVRVMGSIGEIRL